MVSFVLDLPLLSKLVTGGQCKSLFHDSSANDANAAVANVLTTCYNYVMSHVRMSVSIARLDSSTKHTDFCSDKCYKCLDVRL